MSCQFGPGIILCSRGRARCQWCNSEHTLLCDGPGKEPGNTCDAKMCARHATKFRRNGKKLDFCPDCTTAARAIGSKP